MTDDAPLRASPRKKVSTAKARENQVIENTQGNPNDPAVKNTRKTQKLAASNGSQTAKEDAQAAVPDATGWQKILEILGNTYSEISFL